MKDLLKNKVLSVRCGIEDKNSIEQKAQEANMNISDYVRYRCLENQNSDIDDSLLISTLERIEYLTIQLEKKDIKKKEFIKEIKEEVNMIWESLRL